VLMYGLIGFATLLACRSGSGAPSLFLVALCHRLGAIPFSTGAGAPQTPRGSVGSHRRTLASTNHLLRAAKYPSKRHLFSRRLPLRRSSEVISTASLIIAKWGHDAQRQNRPRKRLQQMGFLAKQSPASGHTSSASRVDAIIVGRKTAQLDGRWEKRTSALTGAAEHVRRTIPTRIVLDSMATCPLPSCPHCAASSLCFATGPAAENTPPTGRRRL